MGKGLTKIEPPQGFAAETTSAAVILASSHLGFPLSTTQVCTGSVVGSGIGRGAPVRWHVFGRMVGAWVLTLPAAAVVGAAAYAIAAGIGGTAGSIVLALILAAGCGGVYVLSRKNPVTHHNVNDEWGPAPVETVVGEPEVAA